MMREPIEGESSPVRSIVRRRTAERRRYAGQKRRIRDEAVREV